MYYPIIYHPKKAQKPEKTHQQWQLQLMSLRLRGNCGNTKRIHGLDLMGSWTLEPPFNRPFFPTVHLSHHFLGEARSEAVHCGRIQKTIGLQCRHLAFERGQCRDQLGKQWLSGCMEGWQAGIGHFLRVKVLRGAAILALQNLLCRFLSLVLLEQGPHQIPGLLVLHLRKGGLKRRNGHHLARVTLKAQQIPRQSS